MAVIPLGVDDVQSHDENAARIRLENMYTVDSPFSPDGISRVSRPTLTLVDTIGTGPIYGMYRQDGVFDGLWFIVSGQELYSYDPVSKSSILLGLVQGADYATFAGGSISTGPRLLILRDGVVYSWDGTNLTQVIMPSGEPVGSICYLDSYYFLSVQNYPTEEGRFYWISPGLTDPDPLDFATAERLPDDLVSVCAVGDELWLIGQSTTEVWTASQNADSPFQRIPARAYDYGCLSNDTNVSTIVAGIPAQVWVTDTRVVVMAQSTANPTRISNDSVDEILRTASNFRAYAFAYNRHDFYVLTCDGVTFAYDMTKSTWARWSSYLQPNFIAHFGLQRQQDVFVGDYTSNNIYQFVEGTDDNGQPVIRTVDGLHLVQSNYENCFRVNVIMNSGWTVDYAETAYLELAWSDDLGYTFTDYIQMPMGDTGAYKTDVSYTGLGMMRRPGRLFRFRFSEMARFRLDYATMNEM